MRSPQYGFGSVLIASVALGIGACTAPDNAASTPVSTPAAGAPAESVPAETTPAENETTPRPGDNAPGSEVAPQRSAFLALPLPENPSDSITPDPLAFTRSRYGAQETVEGNYEEFATVLDGPGDLAVVLFTREGLADDSVLSIRYRLEFVPTGDPVTDEQWQLVWIGQQFICAPGRGQQDWGPDYCA